MMKFRRSVGRIPFSLQLFILGLYPVLPVITLVAYERMIGPLNEDLFWLLVFLYLLSLGILAVGMWRLCHDPFHTLANMVSSLHQGDYSRRIKGYSSSDALGVLHEEINRLADILQGNRFAAEEAVRRFQVLIDQLDFAILGVDDHQSLSMLNEYAAKLLQQTRNNLLGKNVGGLGLDDLWGISNGRTLWLRFPERSSRFLVHVNRFREEGRSHNLFMLSDVDNPLREEERNAWKRLIRVLGHELNNSLTPIISLSQSLRSRVERVEMDKERKSSTLLALDTISQRAQGLNRFVEDYARLAKLPDPVRQEVDLESSLARVVQLVDDGSIVLHPGIACRVMVDGDQVGQMWVNLIRNAIEANQETGPHQVEVSWVRDGLDAVVRIDDCGPGVGNGENIFVPFYSTKHGGSGIGLVISRQIAEANGGALELINREEGGCRAVVRLPVCR